MCRTTTTTVTCCACNKLLKEDNELSFVLTQHGYDDSYFDFCNFPCLTDYCTERDINYRHHGMQGRDGWVKTGNQHLIHEHQGEKGNGCKICGWVNGYGLHSTDPKEKRKSQRLALEGYKEDIKNGKRIKE